MTSKDDRRHNYDQSGGTEDEIHDKFHKGQLCSTQRRRGDDAFYDDRLEDFL